MNWTGVIPALTTNLRADLSIDHEAFAAHCRLMVECGCSGLVVAGSLGEAQTLSFDEKVALVRTAVAAVNGRVPVVPGIAALGTAEAVALARAAHAAGAGGLMVLPPYVCAGDWSELKAHFGAVLSATPLAAMLYNNPAAYRADVLPEQVAELADSHTTLRAVKESSGDVRRITAIRALCGDRLDLLVGMDDAVVEAVQAGATGWIAGLVNAFPAESVALFAAAVSGDRERTRRLYEWFLPLLRLDTVPKFVQFIKWVQAEVGPGTPHVRPPRRELTESEVAHARAILSRALANRP